MISTDDEFDWSNQSHLYYNNQEVLTTEKFMELCLHEIKAEYPYLETEEEINKRLFDIVPMINDNDIKNEKEDDNDDIKSFLSDESDFDDNFDIDINEKN